MHVLQISDGNKEVYDGQDILTTLSSRFSQDVNEDLDPEIWR
jgi:hypothetical protein